MGSRTTGKPPAMKRLMESMTSRGRYWGFAIVGRTHSSWSCSCRRGHDRRRQPLNLTLAAEGAAVLASEQQLSTVVVAVAVAVAIPVAVAAGVGVRQGLGVGEVGVGAVAAAAAWQQKW